MDKEQALNIVRAYKNAIRSVVPGAKVFLFGSHARGNARPDSDIDVAVVVSELHTDWLKTSSALWRKTWDVDTAIEPVLIEECHPSPLFHDVMATGIAI